MTNRKNLKNRLVIITLLLLIQHLVGPQVYATSTFVPDVVGLAQSAAETSITSADLVVGTISHGYSDTVPAGNVISQFPPAGTEVPFATEVDLVISLGHQIVTIYVDANATGANDGSSWADAYTELQSALDAVVAGDEIWVAEGTYLPDYNVESGIHTGSRTATFQLISGVALYGGYAGVSEPDPNERDVELYETILSGDLNGNDVGDANRGENSYHVVTGSGTDETAILDGVTITAGYANGGSPHNDGGGMYNNRGSPIVSNCTFIGNSASHSGGGICNDGDTNLISCTFSGNWAKCYGGGVENSGSPRLVNCTFSGNSSGMYGGGIHTGWPGSPSLTNCIFSGNRSGEGGGLSNINGRLIQLVNCTFSGNRGCGISNVGGGQVLTNCILWSNTPGEICGAFLEDRFVVTYSDIKGGWPWPDEGNIDADPCFVDPDSNDFHLLADSPCIDAGDNDAVPPDVTTDLDGNPRFIDDPYTPDTGNGTPPIVDMGAYEFPEPANEVEIDIKPGSCPNPLNVKSKGVLPVAILGSADFDVHDIDVATIQLAGVDPNRSNYENVARPLLDADECECSTEEPDGYLDLTLKFDTQKIVGALGEFSNGEEWVLTLTGVLYDGTSIEGADCIRIKEPKAEKPERVKKPKKVK